MNNQYDLEGYITGMDYHPDAEDFIKRNNKLKKNKNALKILIVSLNLTAIMI